MFGCQRGSHPAVAGLLGSALLGALLAGVRVAEATEEELPPTQTKVTGGYTIIVDAGAAGSRLRVYDVSESMTEIVPDEEDAEKFEVEPGLASFVNEPEKAGPSLKGLFDAAKQLIPTAMHASTPLWIKATAGMRLLSKDLSEQLTKAVDTYMQGKSPFEYKGFELLSGEEEAVLAWISMNIMKGSVQSIEDSVGVLDMGGAGLQVAFRPANEVFASEFRFFINGTRRSVYAKSFMQFGLSAVVNRAKEKLVAIAKASATTIDHPCLHVGFNEVEEMAGKSYNFSGTGDSEACDDLVKSLLHTNYTCLQKPCPLMGVHMSVVPQEKKFYALGNFFYIANGLGLLDWKESQIITPAQIATATKTFCELSLEKARKAGSAMWKYRRNHCLGGHLVANLLAAFGFEDDSLQLTFTRTTKGGKKNAGWTLGAALFETQLMPLFLGAAGGPCELIGLMQNWQAPKELAEGLRLTGALTMRWGWLLAALSLVANVLQWYWPQRRSSGHKFLGGEEPHAQE